MQLHGLHHVTAVTSQAARNLDFYTRVLGLRLVKKTVNQDDVSAYHLFYADKLGSPGTDMTFFDWAHIGPDIRGTDSIVGTLFRVDGREALDYWARRFEDHGVAHEPVVEIGGRTMLPFEDPEGQRLALVDDGGAPFEGEVWTEAGIPADVAIRGFYGVVLSVPGPRPLTDILTRVLNFEEIGRHSDADRPGEERIIYAMDGGGPGKEVHVLIQPGQRRARLGAGGTHHVAFRVRDDAEQRGWNQHLAQFGVGTSGQIDRFYFRSLYFRVSNGILFELATDGPGFATDESPEALGERLALPPFLEPHRAQIEAGLQPIEPARP